MENIDFWCPEVGVARLRNRGVISSPSRIKVLRAVTRERVGQGSEIRRAEQSD